MAEIKEIRDAQRRAAIKYLQAKRYYYEGRPKMSDTEFDYLEHVIRCGYYSYICDFVGFGIDSALELAKLKKEDKSS